MITRKRKVSVPTGTLLNVNTSTEGETIEMKVERIVNNNEPIEDTAPMIYTDRMEGVNAGYDIRTDRMDIAIDAMDLASKVATAKRENYYKPEATIKDGETPDNTQD